MQRAIVINAVGLTEGLLGPNTPRINAFLAAGKRAYIRPVLPALTCSVQATYLTGLTPSGHGIVANGWYNRELAEVQFWKQSNHLVQGRKVWEDLRQTEPGFTCAKMFWWYNMYSSADYSITPRPMYPADGRKVFDVYTAPATLREEVKGDLGDFPFATFWGPAAGMRSPQGGPDAASRWIAASARWVEEKHQPRLNLVYLPHLDYNLQRLGPQHPALAEDVRTLDQIVGELIDFFKSRNVRVLLLSEYGITGVDKAIHLNRAFRKQGWISIKEELGLEILDAGASPAFAVADHQIAHVYLNNPALEDKVRTLMEAQPGVERVYNRKEQAAIGLEHPRAGDLVALSQENAWFTYYYWLEDRLAPDFARCVDIHRKPGYDPVELFLDPSLRLPKLKIAARLLQKKLGFRMLMDVVPLDATLVKGSHGTVPREKSNYPIVIADGSDILDGSMVEPTAIYGLIKKLFGR
ncbi:MAG TPA: alkaline phosphatase family protein [Candidatus Saccharimonadales bacterium]|nr:alkaline phosphatase family protein [Candidatus Saccharimonadales bacterium]